MAIMNKFKGSKTLTSDQLNHSRRSDNQNTTSTLELLKRQISVSDLKLNKYNVYWRTEDKLDKFKREAQVIDNCINGQGCFYKNNINDDIISTLTNNLTKEVFKDIKAQVIKNNGEEEIYEDVSVLSSLVTTSKLSFNQNTFKDVFKKLFIYQQVGLKIDISNGNYLITALKPYEYNIDEYGTIEIINSFDKHGNPNIEKRARTKNFIYIDGKESKSVYFYNLYLDTRFYNKLELILDYQMNDSNLTKEVELNKSKVFIDRKMWKNNPANKEVISLIDVPKNKIQQSAGENASAYFQVLPSKNGLSEIDIVVERKVKKVVNSFELSRKTLGLGEASTDFASSLPYENELTSATVNNYRNYLSGLLTQIVNDLLVTNIYRIDLGKYSLTSEEAVLDRNIKATQSESASIIDKVAAKLGTSIHDDEAYYSTIKFKIENNKTLTLDEEIKAGEMGLLPNLIEDGVE